MEQNRDVIAFRRRFVKDFNLPINLVESPFFEYYMDRYDIFPKEDYFNCCDIINKQFDGNKEAWLNHYAQIRDNIITTIENSDAYNKFNNVDLKEWKQPVFTVGDYNIYNCNNVGKFFISIDLKKANFQTLKWFDKDIVLGADTYEELMEKFGGDEYFKKSKYTRQVIFGKLNPKRTIYFEKYLIGTIFSHPGNYLFRSLYDNAQLITVKSDEIVFEIDTLTMLPKFDKNFLNFLKDDIKKNNGLDVSVEAFKLSRIVCENHNGNTVDGYVRTFYLDDNRKDLKNVSSIFFPQIYAFANNLEINDMDLYFRAEDQTAMFLQPLKLVRVEG